LLSGDHLACTAEALMRSRYTAYVVRDIAYLLKSWHPLTRPDKIDPAAIPEWSDLNIIRTEKGTETDSEGIVEFQAAAFFRKNMLRLHEVSRFVKEDGQWLYVDGDIKNDSLPAEKNAPKVGRNDPCPCGSGKKFKKCCGS
jgi:SEC-C motif-containing protein